MKTRKEISNLIEQYLSHEINTDDKEYLLKLISENTFIKEEFILRQKIDTAIHKQEVMELREELKSLFQNKNTNHHLQEPKPFYKNSWYRAAAVLILLMGFSYLLVNFSGKGKIQESISAIEHNKNITDKSPGHDYDQSEQIRSDAGKETEIFYNQGNAQEHSIEGDDFIAMNFTESAYFESFIDNYRSDQITILQPMPSANLMKGDDVFFTWSNPSGDSLILKIYNNKEESIIRIRALNAYKMHSSLRPGLYYWKLESEDDLIYMNKFYIR